jgi:ubiquinone/menaquinone biosynthesis C-methylase UbiE
VVEGLTPVLDVGCVEGELATHLPEGGWVGVDASAEMLVRAPQPHHLADATALPFVDGSFRSVALLYVLYHLPDPAQASLTAEASASAATRDAPGLDEHQARRTRLL